MNEPLTCGYGCGLSVTETATVESQPKLFVSVTDTCPVPGLFHCTVTLLLVDEPMIAPPITIQLWMLVPGLLNENTLVVGTQADDGPLITGVGLGFMVTG